MVPLLNQMIKPGVLALKKLKLIFIFIAFISAVVLSGCKSLPDGTTVEALSLIDSDYSFTFQFLRQQILIFLNLL